MKMVKFQYISGGKSVYVNPEAVQYVRESSGGVTISFEQDWVTVKGTLKEVAERLEESK